MCGLAKFSAGLEDAALTNKSKVSGYCSVYEEEYIVLGKNQMRTVIDRQTGRQTDCMRTYPRLAYWSIKKLLRSLVLPELSMTGSTTIA